MGTAVWSSQWPTLRVMEGLPVSLGNGLGWSLLQAEIWEQLVFLTSSGSSEEARRQLSRLASLSCVCLVQPHIFCGGLRVPRGILRICFHCWVSERCCSLTLVPAWWSLDLVGTLQPCLYHPLHAGVMTPARGILSFSMLCPRGLVVQLPARVLSRDVTSKFNPASRPT